MKKLLPSILAVVAILVFTASLTGCSENEISVAEDNKIPEDTEEVSLAAIINIGSLKGPTSIGMLKMFEEKPFLGKNIESNYEIVQSPDLMVSKLLSGEIDLAALPTNVAVQLYNKGAAYKLVAVIGYGVLYILYQNEEIKNWEDLANKKINVTAKGSTPDVVLRYLLKKNNIDSSNDVKLDYSVNQVELSQLMISGNVNIAILPEPFVTLVLNKNNMVSIAFDIENEWKKVQDGLPMPMSCLVVSSEFTESHQDVVDTFLTEFQNSVDWVNNNLPGAGLLVEKFDIGMDSRTAEEAIPRCNIKFIDSGLAKNIVNKYIQTLFEFSPEDIGGKIPDEDFYY